MEIDAGSFGRAALFLGVPFVLMVFYFQWKWAKDCTNYVRVLVAQLGGSGAFFMAPKTGGEVSIKNPHTGTTRTWPINELSTIDVLYPGVGFVPEFMQKTIRMAIVNEGDWEPLLNRSPHLRKIASPDIVMVLEKIRDNTTNGELKSTLIGVLDGISTGPTREMIASPAVLGNLFQEKISELAVTVAKDIINPLNEAIKKLGERLNPVIVYIGLGLVLVLMVYLVFQIKPIIDKLDGMGNIGTIARDISLIKQSLGIK